MHFLEVSCFYKLWRRGNTHFLNPLYNDERKVNEADSTGNPTYADIEPVPYSEPKYHPVTGVPMADGSGSYLTVGPAVIANPVYGSGTAGLSVNAEEDDHIAHKGIKDDTHYIETVEYASDA